MSNPAGRSDSLSWLALVRRYIPILAWLPAYKREYLRWDAVSGVTVGALVIPASMAYAQLAGLPPVTGLYAATVPLVVYGLIGTSRHLQFGPSSTLAIMTAAAVVPLAQGDPGRYATIAATLALMVGVILAVAGVLRLGFIASFLSEPVITGFKAGAALIVIAGQLPKLFGVEGGSGLFFPKIASLIRDLDEANYWTLMLGIVSGALIISIERLRPLWPAALIVVLGSILLMTFSNLESRGVEVAGDIPTGFPAPVWPTDLSMDDLQALAPMAFAIGLVAYVEGIAVARGYAVEHHYKISPDQELIAVGGGNIAAGIFQGFPVDGSLSRSSVNVEAGARTQAAGMVTALVVIIVVVALAFIFEDLPETVLAAIIITAVSSMISYSHARRIWDVGRYEIWFYVATLLGVLTFGIAEGILITVGLSLLVLIGRVSRPNVAILGRVDQSNTFRDVEDWSGAETYPNLLIVRLDGLMFFANHEGFEDFLRDEIHRRDEVDDPVRCIILDAEGITDVDFSALEGLTDLLRDLRKNGIQVMIVRVRLAVLSEAARSDLMDVIGEGNVYLTILDAVHSFQGSGEPVPPAGPVA